MSHGTRGGPCILGHLKSSDGRGLVRMADRFHTHTDDLWSALTDPQRVGRRLGEVQGDLRLDCQFRARHHHWPRRAPRTTAADGLADPDPATITVLSGRRAAQS